MQYYRAPHKVSTYSVVKSSDKAPPRSVCTALHFSRKGYFCTGTPAATRNQHSLHTNVASRRAGILFASLPKLPCCSIMGGRLFAQNLQPRASHVFCFGALSWVTAVALAFPPKLTKGAQMEDARKQGISRTGKSHPSLRYQACRHSWRAQAASTEHVFHAYRAQFQVLSTCRTPASGLDRQITPGCRLLVPMSPNTFTLIAQIYKFAPPQVDAEFLQSASYDRSSAPSPDGSENI